MRTKYKDLPEDIKLNLCHINAKLTVVLAAVDHPYDFDDPDEVIRNEMREIYTNIQTMLED